MKPNFSNVKRALEKIRFGIVKMFNSAMLHSPVTFMIETLTMTDDGHLWCATTDLPEEALTKGNLFTVNLKYVEKTQGLFIKLAGRAEIVGDDFPHEWAVSNSITGQRLIRVRIEEVYGYQKYKSSPHTSFLESLNNFTITKSIFA